MAERNEKKRQGQRHGLGLVGLIVNYKEFARKLNVLMELNTVDQDEFDCFMALPSKVWVVNPAQS